MAALTTTLPIVMRPYMVRLVCASNDLKPEKTPWGASHGAYESS